MFFKKEKSHQEIAAEITSKKQHKSTLYQASCIVEETVKIRPENTDECFSAIYLSALNYRASAWSSSVKPEEDD